jgi:hypothetical protein
VVRASPSQCRLPCSDHHRGLAAWLLWCFAHIYFLIGFRNRLLVMVNWAWNFATFQRGARLITGIVGAQRSSGKPASLQMA